LQKAALRLIANPIPGLAVWWNACARAAAAEQINGIRVADSIQNIGGLIARKSIEPIKGIEGFNRVDSQIPRVAVARAGISRRQVGVISGGSNIRRC